MAAVQPCHFPLQQYRDVTGLCMDLLIEKGNTLQADFGSGINVHVTWKSADWTSELNIYMCMYIIM